MSRRNLGFPLAWPAGWKRKHSGARRIGPYRVTAEQARRDMLDGLRLLGAKEPSIVISTNLTAFSGKQPEDPGVAVYWIGDDGREQVIACDKWTTVAANLRSIGLAVEALRALKRCGASEIMERAFRGFLALPPASSGRLPEAKPARPWREVFGFPPATVPTPWLTAAVMEARYRDLLKSTHPDQGGKPGELEELQRARAEALAAFEVKS